MVRSPENPFHQALAKDIDASAGLAKRQAELRAMHKSLFLLLMVAVLPATSMADEITSELADRLVTLQHVADDFARYGEHCLATRRAITPEMLAARKPDYFGGIRPTDTKWAAVVALYDDMIRELCARPTQAEYLKVVSSTLARTLTSQQLEDAIAFYSSATGEALIASHLQVADALYNLQSAAVAKYDADLTVRFQFQIQQLAQLKSDSL